MITSTQNSQVKQINALNAKAKERRQQGLFVAEGLRMVRETPRELLQQVYVTETMASEQAALLFELTAAGAGLETVSDSVMSAMSETRTPQGILAVVRQPRYELSQLLGGGRDSLILCLECIQDPGNLGTLIRTAEGAGVTGLLMSRDCVDIFSPKVVRSTMGALYRMPFVCSEDFRADLRSLQEKEGIRLFAAALDRDACEYTRGDYRGNTGLVIGNEGNGLTTETIDLCNGTVFIPMEGRLESLNAGVAGAILMYEARRQRSL